MDGGEGRRRPVGSGMEGEERVSSTGRERGGAGMAYGGQTTTTPSPSVDVKAELKGERQTRVPTETKAPPSLVRMCLGILHHSSKRLEAGHSPLCIGWQRTLQSALTGAAEERATSSSGMEEVEGKLVERVPANGNLTCAGYSEYVVPVVEGRGAPVDGGKKMPRILCRGLVIMVEGDGAGKGVMGEGGEGGKGEGKGKAPQGKGLMGRQEAGARENGERAPVEGKHPRRGGLSSLTSAIERAVRESEKPITQFWGKVGKKASVLAKQCAKDVSSMGSYVWTLAFPKRRPGE